MTILDTVAHKKLVNKADYDSELRQLQHEALAIQHCFAREHRRGIVVLEGWDAAGKGGAIRRFAEKLDPRAMRVHRIAAPKPEEQGIHYLYRFWQMLPVPGALAVFDRSWYGRVMVERVEGFCQKQEWQRAFEEINSFEKMLVDDGVKIVKIFLHIDKEEQFERFEKRYRDPQKRWKLSVEDFRNREKWDDYENAIEDMLSKCHKASPWHVIGANNKKAARLEVIRTINDKLSAGMEIAPPPLDEGVMELAEQLFAAKSE